MSDLTIAEVPVTVNMADEAVAELVDAGSNLMVEVDAHDVVSALDNNDGLVLSFIWEMLERAGSSDLLADLRDRINDQLHPVG